MRDGFCFFFSSRRRHTRCGRDWSSDVCSSDLGVADHPGGDQQGEEEQPDPDVEEIVLGAVCLLWLCVVWGPHEKSGRRDPGEPVAPRHRRSLLRVAEKDATIRTESAIQPMPRAAWPT